MNFEIVEVNGKKYAQFEDGKDVRKFLKRAVIVAGGAIYRHEGKLVFSGIGAYGNLQEWYKSLFSKVQEVL